MRDYVESPFVFSPRYRLLRHLLFWTTDAIVFTYIFRIPTDSLFSQFAVSFFLAIPQMIYAYSMMYWIIPKFLFKEKFWQFILMVIVWGIAGWFWNYISRAYIFFPLIHKTTTNLWAAASFLAMTTVAGIGSMIILFKYWIKKQRDYLSSEKEKVNAELQLLKAQVHPHFLFNTLNNIYSFSLQNSKEAPQMILKLSSLLSYMLYDCKANEVLLEKEIAIMRNYIDLEKERYAKLEVSLNFEGDIKDKWIAPLLLLPFLENAFKHGTSEQLEKPWLSMDISVKQNMMRCKIANSKNEPESFGESLLNPNGIGIQNVKKRLAYLYPGKHELKLSDEGDFFVVSLLLDLTPGSVAKPSSEILPLITTETVTV